MVGATVVGIDIFLLPFYIFKNGFAIFMWAVLISLIVKGINSR